MLNSFQQVFIFNILWTPYCWTVFQVRSHNSTIIQWKQDFRILELYCSVDEPSIWLALLYASSHCLPTFKSQLPNLFRMPLLNEDVHISCIQIQYFFYRNVLPWFYAGLYGNRPPSQRIAISKVGQWKVHLSKGLFPPVCRKAVKQCK